MVCKWVRSTSSVPAGGWAPGGTGSELELAPPVDREMADEVVATGPADEAVADGHAPDVSTLPRLQTSISKAELKTS